MKLTKLMMIFNKNENSNNSSNNSNEDYINNGSKTIK